MTYRKVNADEELARAIQGKTTKTETKLAVYLALYDYPAIQAQVAKHFSLFY